MIVPERMLSASICDLHCRSVAVVHVRDKPLQGCTNQADEREQRPRASKQDLKRLSPNHSGELT
jgi:hypothetical protein